MRPSLLVIAALSVAPLAAVGTLSGCKEEKKAGQATPAPAKSDGHDHGSKSGGAHGGPVIALGEQTIGAFTAKATRDAGQIVAGKDAAFDVTVTPAAAGGAAGGKVAAVRIWVGTQDGKGSVKAKAGVEDPKEPSRWHSHAEIPSPLPAGSKLWVEIEDDKGVTSVGGFDLKA